MIQHWVLTESLRDPRALREEFANAMTHGLGLALSIAGLAWIVVLTSYRGTAWEIVGCSIYGATLVLLYLASTLYHAVQHKKAKRALQIFDHCAIYLLIAGTYTPITLTVLRGPWGWSLFGVVWGLALVGIFCKIALDAKRFRFLSTLTYVLMGWVGVVAFKPMIDTMSPYGFAWLVAGGLAYTFGVYFYALDDRKPFFHAIWHLFVIAGSALHFAAIMTEVVPPLAV